MKRGFNLKMQFAGAGLAIALLSTGCAMIEPRAERYVPPPVGSTWVSARRDTGSYGSGSAQTASKFLGERMWQGIKVNAYESPEQTLLATPEGQFVAQVKGNSPLITWDPPVGWNYPLEVGKTWTKKSSITIHAAKRTLPFEYTNKVEAYENIALAAGTFWAFRVSTSDTLGNENITWFAPDLGIIVKTSLRRTAKSAQGVGTRETELVSQTIRK